MSVRISVDLKLDASSAFETMVEELSVALEQLGMRFQPGAEGSVAEAGVEVGQVVRWQPPQAIALNWRAVDWQPDGLISLELQFSPLDDGTRVTIEQREWGKWLGEEKQELAGWFAQEVAAPVINAMCPRRLGDWLTDRRARRPSGPLARATYRDPLYHRPNFMAILAELNLRREDYLLEVGCGGGALLHDALKSGCRAAAIDHSSDMVKVARETNHEAVEQKRLEIRQGNAASLPYPDRTFTCAVTTGVFGFIAEPLKALTEVQRVLVPGGRFILFTGAKALRGTPAAPEPIASRLHFYEDDELREMARKAGFVGIRLEHPDFERFARQAEVPEEHLGLFRDRENAQFLVARKD